MTVGPFLVGEHQNSGGTFCVFVRGPFGRVVVGTCNSEAAALRLAASWNAAEFAEEVAAKAAELDADDFEEWIKGQVQQWWQDRSRPDANSADGVLIDAVLEDERAAKDEAERQAVQEASIQKAESDDFEIP